MMVFFLIAIMRLSFVAAQPSAWMDDVKQLTEGVKRIAKPGVPGPLTCIRENAFPVVLGKAGGHYHPVVAAARMGSGRIVAFGHGGLFETAALQEADTTRLLINAAHWASRPSHQRSTKPVVGLIFSHDLAKPLEQAGFEVRHLSCPGWEDQIAGIDLLVGDNIVPDRDHEQALNRFIKGGGGFLASGLAWGWMQIHPHLDLTRDYALNRVLAEMGLAYVDGYIDEIPPLSQTDTTALSRAHALNALQRLETASGSEIGQVQALVTTAYRWIPAEEQTFRDAVRQ
ncbi:MAG TPA: hypothetical protein PKO06_05185, partial [Candidatus Ozemobacteraceae bacterium]|nr:hypothetical protein [Candidatus Ozemobacteraceae bacterium]